MCRVSPLQSNSSPPHPHCLSEGSHSVQPTPKGRGHLSMGGESSLRGKRLCKLFRILVHGGLPVLSHSLIQSFELLRPTDLYFFVTIITQHSILLLTLFHPRPLGPSSQSMPSSRQSCGFKPSLTPGLFCVFMAPVLGSAISPRIPRRGERWC